MDTEIKLPLLSKFDSNYKLWLVNPTKFGEVLAACLRLDVCTKQQLATSLEVAVGTLERWEAGISKPGARVQHAALLLIREKLINKLWDHYLKEHKVRLQVEPELRDYNFSNCTEKEKREFEYQIQKDGLWIYRSEALIDNKWESVAGVDMTIGYLSEEDKLSMMRDAILRFQQWEIAKKIDSSKFAKDLIGTWDQDTLVDYAIRQMEADMNRRKTEDSETLIEEYKEFYLEMPN